MKQAQKDDGTLYWWQYILWYVNDILMISHKPKKVILKEIGTIKPGSLGTPKIYLSNKVSKVTLDNSVKAWVFNSSQYVKDTMEKLRETWMKRGWH